MPARRTESETVPFTITLLANRAGALEYLAKTGYAGQSTRAGVAAAIINRVLDDMWERGRLPMLDPQD